MNIKKLTLTGLVLFYSLISSQETLTSNVKKDTLPKKEFCLYETRGSKASYDLDLDGSKETISYGDASSRIDIKDINDGRILTIVKIKESEENVGYSQGAEIIVAPDIFSGLYDVCIYKDNKLPLITIESFGDNGFRTDDVTKYKFLIWTGNNLYELKSLK